MLFSNFVRRPVVLIAVCITTLAASAVVLRAFQTGEQPTTLLSVDFRAFNRDGLPVVDLKPEEITLKLAGRPREILALQPVDVAAAPAAAVKEDADPPSPPFFTNASPGYGRDVMIVVDDEGIATGREKPVRDGLQKLVSSLSAGDRIAWMTPRDPGSRVHLTARHKAITDAIANLVGRAQRGETSADAACRSQRNMHALLAVFESIAQSVPTVVVFVSNGFTSPAAMRSVAGGVAPEGPCEIRTQDLDNLALAAAASHAHVYGILIVDDVASGAPGAADMTGGFEHVAGLSGNAVMRLVAGAVPPVERIAAETGAYYVAGFEVPLQECNGSKQHVEVSSTRPGVTIRTWPMLVMPKAGATGTKASALKLRDMLTVSKMFRDLAIRAAVHTSRASPDGKRRIVCVFEPGDRSTQISEATIALFDDKGSARGTWTGQASDFKQSPIVAAINAPAPGNYRLRVAAKDASGAGGTVDQEIRVSAPGKGSVSVSEMVLGTQGGAGFAPRLQFASEQLAIGVVEIFGAPKTATITTAFELAASETGPALATLPGAVQAVRDDLRMASVRFPIGPMPPGDVVVRAVVTVDGQALEARPARTLRKIGR